MGPAGYQDEDMAYADLIKNVIAPPDQPQQTQAAPDPRTAVPSGEPPNPTLKVRPQVAQAAPASVQAVPANVTPNGAEAGAPKTWADYVRAGLNRGMTAADQSQTALTAIQNQPTAETTNAPLEAQRSALAQPLNPSEKEYRPGIGTRIVRGIDAVRRGGVLGAVDPADVGGTAYGAPNRQFNIDTQRRAAQVGALDTQMSDNLKNQAADTARLKDIASEQRAQATTALDLGKTATGQQNAENKDEVTTLRQQIADNGGVPKNYEQAVIAANDPDLPQAKRVQYERAAKEMQSAELKKFTYAQRASKGPNEDQRQPMIDAATQQVKDIQDRYQYDPDTNTYSDPNNPTKVYSPDEFTDMKNAISTKLDAALTKAKLRPLGVRFNAKDAGGGKNLNAPAAPAQTAPKSVNDVQKGQDYNGYTYLGGDKADQKSWKKAGQ